MALNLIIGEPFNNSVRRRYEFNHSKFRIVTCGKTKSQHFIPIQCVYEYTGCPKKCPMCNVNWNNSRNTKST